MEFGGAQHQRAEFVAKSRDVIGALMCIEISETTPPLVDHEPARDPGLPAQLESETPAFPQRGHLRLRE